MTSLWRLQTANSRRPACSGDRDPGHSSSTTDQYRQVTDISQAAGNPHAATDI